ncbi:MAG TPA: xanthine dehydrogenase family protein subunit M [Paraburkholderia sp.]
MKPASFEYHSPKNIDEALSLVATLENAKLLAGGQTLMPMINFRFLMPDHIIDLNKIAELQSIRQQGARLVIGAMTRQRDIERSPLVQRTAPLIPEAYALVSHRQIRNRGTLGGSLCHLDPSSEQPCFLAAQGATLCVRGSQGERRVAMQDWVLMYMTPALEPDELLVSIECDLWPEGHGWAFTEYARRQGDYAIVGVAVLATCDAARRLTRVAVAICGVAAAPLRLTEVEQAVLGQPADEDTIRLIAAHATEIDAMADAHVSADYRRHLAGVLTGRALATAFARMRAPGAA